MPAPEPGQRWGILGGVFDPVHRGHVSLAEDISKGRRLDGVLFVPSYRPPHRLEESRAPFEDRLSMLRLALADHPRFITSTIEQESDEPGYTYNTVRALKQRHPGVAFSFLIGADNAESFRTWYKWEKILEEVVLLVGYRPGADVQAVKSFPSGRMELVETGEYDLSSTRIRECVLQGVSARDLKVMVPDDVAEYILKNELYR